MDINNNFLDITAKTKIVNTNNDVPEKNQAHSYSVNSNSSSANNTDVASINGKEVNAYGSATDAQILAMANDSAYIDDSPASVPSVYEYYNGYINVEDIKEKIYRLHNTTISFDDIINEENQPKIELPFNNVDEFFDFMAGKPKSGENPLDYPVFNILKDSTGNLPENISNKTGITRAQLVALTRFDTFEHSLGDFFESLNRAFSDKQYDEVITYNDIRNLFYYANESDYYNTNCSASEFRNKVETYAKKVQDEFVSLKNQETLTPFSTISFKCWII
jgi:hypothetical protein